MTDEAVEPVRRYYELFNQREYDAIEELIAEDFHADFTRRLIEPGETHGREAASQEARQIRETWESLTVEPRELVPVGDRVIAVVHNTGRGRDGVVVDALTAQVWTVKDGRLTGFEYFGTPEEAFAALGVDVER